MKENHCKICNSATLFFASGLILSKYTISYFRCKNCGFLQTEEPYWLLEAYQDPISKIDIGLISRNITLSVSSSAIIETFFDPQAHFLDYGGGNGMFVRLMRDRGYDFYYYDKYTKNIFSEGFEANENERYELVTAFEVFEHLPNPVDEVEKILQFSDSILFTTLLYPETLPLPHEWWYFTPLSGQHISLYSKKSLMTLAEKFQLKYYTNNFDFHLFSKRTISDLKFSLICNHHIQKILLKFKKRQTLRFKDYFKLTGIDLTNPKQGN